MNINGIEIALLFIIVCIQALIFFRTKRQITHLGRTFSNSWYFALTSIYVPRDALDTKTPEEILSAPHEYSDSQMDEQGSLSGSLVHIRIVEAPPDANKLLIRIYFSINRYLLRNAHGSTDFNLVKDITERNLDSLEEEIHATMSLPLYLGLMGTMLGIVIGLFSMSDISLSFTGSVRDEQLASGIQVLLGGVKIAMIASFVGLFFTIVNSGWFFRRTKSRVEYQKNVFYLYLQSELLPVSGDAVASTFQLLQNNLTRFNDSFTNNVDRLSGVFSTNVEALKLQEKIMSSIERIDLGEIAHYNIKVLKEIRTSTKEFERFNGHFENVNSFVENSRVLSERMTDILNRTDDLQSLADAYVKNMEKSETLLSFVAQHLLDLENLRRETSESVAEVGIRIKDAFGGLETHMHQSTKSLEEFTVHELDLLKTALADSRTNLSNLQFLADLKDDVSSFKDSSASQGERIRTSVVALNTATAETNHTLRALLDQSTNSGFNRVTSSIRRLLRQERTDEGS